MEVLRRMEGEDERVRVIARDRNDGTYVCKNVGLLRAGGEYVAFQDSDDWSHPDRLGKSIAVLESEPEILAVTTDWVRMTTEGEMVLQNKNHYAYRACISLVFRREEMLRRSGFFDSVRAEGDGEFESRIKRLFGEHRLVNCPVAPELRPRASRIDHHQRAVRTDPRPGKARSGGIPQGLPEVARGDRRRT